MPNFSCAVHYSGQIKNITISDKGCLLDELRSHKIPVPFSCGGEGICTTCRIIVSKGNLTKRGALENERASERDFKDQERLSCQCTALSDLEIAIP